MADEVDPDPPPPPFVGPEEVVVTTPTEPEPTPEPAGPVPVVPPDAPPPKEGCFAKRTCLEKFFIVVIVIITIMCLAFVGLFIVWYLFSKPPVETCLSEDCVTAGSRLRSYMDDNVDPCNDFYQYACGGWVNKQTMNDDEMKIDAITQITDANRVQIKTLLKGVKQANDTDFKNKPRDFYYACMNTELLGRKKIEPFKELLQQGEFGGEFGNIPTLDPDWNETKFDLKDTLLKLIKFDQMPLFTIGIQRDVKNSNKNRIVISDAKLEFDKQTYEKGRDSPRVKHREIWLMEVLEMLGALGDDINVNTTTIAIDVAAVMDLEMEISKLKRFDIDKKDKDKSDNEMSIALMDKEFEWMNTWLDFLQSYAPTAELVSTHYVIVTEAEFLKSIKSLLNATPKRVMANYLMYSLLYYTNFLGPKFVALHDKMNKAVYNTEPKPQWEQCAKLTEMVFPDFISRMYIDKYFQQESKTYLEKMIIDLKKAFLHLLDENPWMTLQTKREVKKKINRIHAKIAYPDYLLDDRKLNQMYASISAKRTGYMQTIIDQVNFRVKNNIDQYGKEIDKNKWSGIYPITVNAAYTQSDNQIIFPAAFLQAPLFDGGYSSSMNYGSIGSIIGHELTHAVDDTGRKFNPDGEKKDWWNKKDIQTYEAQSQCFVERYGCFKWDGHSIDGKKTLADNIADNGGLKQAFTAYRSYIRRKGLEEQRLPGVADLNHNQLFFLSFAQSFCSKVRDEYKEQAVKKVHAPKKYRVIGVLQNSEAFSDAFKCRSGSRMNPRDKCQLW